MGIIALLTAALEAFVAYATLKRERLSYELAESSELRLRNIRSRIDVLRDKHTEAATQEADMLFVSYQREKLKYEKYLTAL